MNHEEVYQHLIEVGFQFVRNSKNGYIIQKDNISLHCYRNVFLIYNSNGNLLIRVPVTYMEFKEFVELINNIMQGNRINGNMRYEYKYTHPIIIGVNNLLRSFNKLFT